MSRRKFVHIKNITACGFFPVKFFTIVRGFTPVYGAFSQLAAGVFYIWAAGAVSGSAAAGRINTGDKTYDKTEKNRLNSS